MPTYLPTYPIFFRNVIGNRGIFVLIKTEIITLHVNVFILFLILFTVASLLNCLHQLKNENHRLEDHVKSLTARRDHLLAVNARLSVPFSTSEQSAAKTKEQVMLLYS